MTEVPPVNYYFINQIPVKRDWKNDVKNIIGLYAVYRKLTSDPKKQVS